MAYPHYGNLICDRPPLFGDTEQIAEVKRYDQTMSGTIPFATVSPQKGYQHPYYEKVYPVNPGKPHNTVYVEFDCPLCKRTNQVYSATNLRVDPRFLALFITSTPENDPECSCGTVFTLTPSLKSIDVYINPESV